MTLTLSATELVRRYAAPVLASVGLAGLVVTFAVEMGAFRRAVEQWAQRDLDSRALLAAANLAEPLKTGDFHRLYDFGAACEREGLHLTILAAGGGTYYSSRAHELPHDDCAVALARANEWTVRLALPRDRVLAPFRRARMGFVWAALAGGVGMLLVFLVTYRQHVRLRELARLERFRREFIADVSHELKTPLTGILGAVDLLSGDGRVADATTSQLLTMIGRESKRLDALAQGILDLARLESADDAVHKVPTDLADLVNEAVEGQRLQADRAGVALAVKTKPLTAVCDPQLIARALANLIGNAVRHSGSKDVLVSLESAGAQAVLVVEDHGRGIPPAESKRVFERFHRVDPARAAETGGAGLGLAIVGRIARLHGGSIALEAAQPSGCRFILTFPIKH